MRIRIKTLVSKMKITIITLESKMNISNLKVLNINYKKCLTLPQKLAHFQTLLKLGRELDQCKLMK
jgi:hypothetical protein